MGKSAVAAPALVEDSWDRFESSLVLEQIEDYWLTRLVRQRLSQSLTLDHDHEVADE